MKDAERLFNKIGFGKKSMVARPSRSYVDRQLRRLINNANKNGDCIINAGFGYYRPTPGIPEEEKELKEYLWAELTRGRDVLYKRLKMHDTFERGREVGILHNHTGTTGQP